jgi:hypothetical protein
VLVARSAASVPLGWVGRRRPRCQRASAVRGSGGLTRWARDGRREGRSSGGGCSSTPSPRRGVVAVNRRVALPPPARRAGLPSLLGWVAPDSRGPSQNDVHTAKTDRRLRNRNDQEDGGGPAEPARPQRSPGPNSRKQSASPQDGRVTGGWSMRACRETHPAGTTTLESSFLRYPSAPRFWSRQAAGRGSVVLTVPAGGGMPMARRSSERRLASLE